MFMNHEQLDFLNRIWYRNQLRYHPNEEPNTYPVLTTLVYPFNFSR